MSHQQCRVAVFYDGTYLAKVRTYYLMQHARRAHLSIKGLHRFIEAEVARHEGTDADHCRIVEAAHFRGRLNAQQAMELDRLYAERVFDDVLMRAGVIQYHQQLAMRPDGTFEEKRVDVLLALEAYEYATLKKPDVIVLVTGDADFVPLVRKLNTLGVRVMILGWEFSYEYEGQSRNSHISYDLIEHANYPVLMHQEVDAPQKDPLVEGIFVPRPETRETREARESREPRPAPQERAARRIDQAWHTGTIVNLRTQRDYGFIKPDDGEEDGNVFFHHSHLKGLERDDLHIGLHVKYELRETDRDPAAFEVQLA
ncbi:MAG: NYN domain-containing protein [Comamonas sp.]